MQRNIVVIAHGLAWVLCHVNSSSWDHSRGLSFADDKYHCLSRAWKMWGILRQNRHESGLLATVSYKLMIRVASDLDRSENAVYRKRKERLETRFRSEACQNIFAKNVTKD